MKLGSVGIVPFLKRWLNYINNMIGPPCIFNCAYYLYESNEKIYIKKLLTLTINTVDIIAHFMQYVYLKFMDLETRTIPAS